jgi:hypothetical protein
MSKIQFEFDVECDFIQALQLADEIVNEMGMTPTYITTQSGQRVKYDEDDAIEVRKCDMTEQEYIEKHIVI